jgi:aryl-alcohol dehydrogenase-like predicted oxidoreductase
MEYRVLGRTGVRVSPLCLGAMMFGSWGNPDHGDCARIIHRGLDAGINFIDTADVYSRGESEEIVGKALQALPAGRRDDVVLASKVHGPMGEGPNSRGNSRRWILSAVEASLRRLGTDHLDLYQIHRPDPACEDEEALAALTDLQRAGKIRYAGSSTFPAHEMVEDQWIAERRGLTRFTSEQPPYSMLVRGVEADVLPVAARYGMGVLTWSPLAGGYLSGRYRTGVAPGTSHREQVMIDRGQDLQAPGPRAKRSAAEALGELADESHLTVVEMALAFVLEHPAVTSAIIGPRTMAQLETQLDAPNTELPAELLDRIDEVVPPGSNVDPSDRGWTPPALAAAHRRR